MIFRTRTATIAKIHFDPQELIYSGPIDMIEFSLTNYTVTKGTYGKKTLLNICSKKLGHLKIELCFQE